MNLTVVKVGGSLALKPNKLQNLCIALSAASKNNRFIVVPGGGEFADVVRAIDARFKLNCETAHRMAILGMDQYGFLLADLTPDSIKVRTIEETEKALGLCKLPIFLPSTMLFNENPLENSWDLTSDSIAAYLAGQMRVGKLLLVTDVDGVYDEDPKRHRDANIIKELSVQELLAAEKRTSVDRFLPKLLMQLHIDCFVVNGLFPERVVALLGGQSTLCTKINSNRLL